MIPFIPVSGIFYRAIVSERRHLLLEKPRPVDCGRYHAPGQHALYMSATAEWARLVANAYSDQDGLKRTVFPLAVTTAQVLDLGDAEACRRLGIDAASANLSWKKALDSDRTPPSWHVADAVRAAGADGLIDRSRSFPGAWHLTLFRWNEPGAPQVSPAGEGEPILRNGD